VIHDVDESLRALVKRDALNGSKVEVAFDAPTKDWVAKANAPTIDMYLYRHPRGHHAARRRLDRDTRRDGHRQASAGCRRAASGCPIS
jgi:hypothetical protein